MPRFARVWRRGDPDPVARGPRPRGDIIIKPYERGEESQEVLRAYLSDISLKITHTTRKRLE